MGREKAPPLARFRSSAEKGKLSCHGGVEVTSLSAAAQLITSSLSLTF